MSGAAASRDARPAAAPGAGFLTTPGLPGAIGALLDEYARAAEDFCRVVESLPPAEFGTERPSPDPQTVSQRAVCAHVCGAAFRYADYIRKARGLPYVQEPRVVPVPDPAAVRPLLVEAFRYTEGAVEGMHAWSEAEISKILFQVRWGPTYDTDMILEHAICHLLRHRRQLERWSR